jgi:hypothetical protein
MQAAKVTHPKRMPANPEVIPNKHAHGKHATSERARPGDRGFDPHKYSTGLSRDQICVRPCCQSATAPCARALPSSLSYSHDEKFARITWEQVLTSPHV